MCLGAWSSRYMSLIAMNIKNNMIIAIYILFNFLEKSTIDSVFMVWKCVDVIYFSTNLQHDI